MFVFTLENAVARLRLLAPRVGGDGAAARFCADAAPSGAPVGTYDVVGELLRPSALNQSTRYVVGPHSLSPPPPAPGAGRVGVDDASQTLPPVCGGAAALEPGYWARLATGLLPAAGGGGGSAWVSHADWVSPCHRGVPAADAVARLAARLRRSPAWVQLVGDSVTRALLCDLCTLLHPGSVLRKGDEETCGDDAAALQIWDMGHNPRARHGARGAAARTPTPADSRPSPRRAI